MFKPEEGALEARFSSSNSYLLCRRKYLYEYVYFLEHKHTDGYATAADTGTMGHAALAAHYEGKTDDAARLALVRKATEMGLYDSDNYHEARAAVERYLAWVRSVNPDAGTRTLFVEKRLKAYLGTFHGIKVYLTGAMDRVFDDDFEFVHVMDHKFVASLAREAAKAKRSRQLLTYAWLVEQEIGRPVESVMLNLVLRKPLKTKPTLLQDRIVKYVDRDELEQHVKDLRTVAAEMVKLHIQVGQDDHTSVIPNPGEWCEWCPFREPCEIWNQDRTAAVKMLKTNYVMKEEES